MASSPTDPPFERGPWSRLPRLKFSRGGPPTAEHEELAEVAYNVGDAETLATEFDNRERRLRGRAKVTKK